MLLKTGRTEFYKRKYVSYLLSCYWYKLKTLQRSKNSPLQILSSFTFSWFDKHEIEADSRISLYTMLVPVQPEYRK